MLVARGERSACDPATDVAYCAKEERLLGFSAGEGDLTRPSARPAGLVAVFGGRCRGLVPTGQLELRDRLRHNGHEELYLTILSYALHVLLYHFFVQGWHLYHAVSLLQYFLSLHACTFRPTCRSWDRKSSRIEFFERHAVVQTRHRTSSKGSRRHTTLVRYRTDEALFTSP
jgi:hypothetical protein